MATTATASNNNSKREGEGPATTTTNPTTTDNPPPKKKFKKHHQPKSNSLENPFPRGTPGLLVTCPTGKEKYCTREIFSLLDDVCSTSTTAAATAAATTKKSIKEQLEQELSDLRDANTNPNAVRRFKLHRSIGTNGIVFIQFNETGLPSPLEVVLTILNDAIKAKSCKARWITRIIPVETSCPSDIEAIRKTAEKIVDKHFPTTKEDDNIKGGKKFFAVDYQHRACSRKLDRLEVINAFANRISQPAYVVNLKTPDRTILVEVIKNNCFVCVVRDYQKLLKFNLQRLVEREIENED